MEADLNVSNAIQAMGRDIIRQAIEAPIRQISANAGVDGSIVVQQVLQGKNGFGFNLQLVNMKT